MSPTLDTQLVPRTSVLGNDLLLLKLLDGFPRNFRAIKNRKLEVAMKTGRNGAPGLLRSSAFAANGRIFYNTPELPTSTLSFITRAAILMVSPRWISPS